MDPGSTGLIIGVLFIGVIAGFGWLLHRRARRVELRGPGIEAVFEMPEPPGFAELPPARASPPFMTDAYVVELGAVLEKRAAPGDDVRLEVRDR